MKLESFEETCKKNPAASNMAASKVKPYLHDNKRKLYPGPNGLFLHEARPEAERAKELRRVKFRQEPMAPSFVYPGLQEQRISYI